MEGMLILSTQCAATHIIQGHIKKTPLGAVHVRAAQLSQMSALEHERELARKRVFAQISRQVSPGSSYSAYDASESSTSQSANVNPVTTALGDTSLQEPLQREQALPKAPSPAPLSQVAASSPEQVWEESLAQSFTVSRQLTQGFISTSFEALLLRVRNAPSRWRERLKRLGQGAALMPLAPLPDGWSSMWDERTGRPYYVSPDGVSMWTRPEGVQAVTSPPRADAAPAQERESQRAADGAQADGPPESADEPPDEQASEPGSGEGSSTVAVGPLYLPEDKASAVKTAWAANAARRMNAKRTHDGAAMVARDTAEDTAESAAHQIAVEDGAPLPDATPASIPRAAALSAWEVLDTERTESLTS